MTGMEVNSEPQSIGLFISPEVDMCINDYVHSKSSDFDEKCDSLENYQKSGLREVRNNSLLCEKQKTSYYFDRAIGLGQLSIQDDIVAHKSIPKNVIGILDPDINHKSPGKWLSFNRSSSMVRRYSFSESEDQQKFYRKRSIGGMSVTPRRNRPLEQPSNREHMDIASFHRSLKLLGLQPKDVGINDDVDSPIIQTPSSRLEMIGPTFHTRLRKRSFSAENLRSIMQDHISDNRASGDRRILSKAVYEEWYFQKLQEARRKKEAQDVNELKKQEHFEKVKTKQKQKTEENFIKWNELKNKEKQKSKQQIQKKKTENGVAGDFRLMNGTARVKPNQEEVFLLWKRDKDKLLKRKKVKENVQKEAMKLDNEKKASADIAFKLWKNQIDETLKEKARENERKKQEEVKAKREKEHEKRENAKSSFLAWKKKKDAELKKKCMEEKIAEEQKKSETSMQEVERLYEAEQAFEEWLEQLEERRSRQIEAIRKQKQKQRHQFPWSPGGSVHW